MVAIDASSSCGPQPNCQFPPPIAHVPRPSGVISKSVFPSCRVRTYIHSFLLYIVIVSFKDRSCSILYVRFCIKQAEQRVCRAFSSLRPPHILSSALALPVYSLRNCTTTNETIDIQIM